MIGASLADVLAMLSAVMASQCAQLEAQPITEQCCRVCYCSAQQLPLTLGGPPVNDITLCCPAGRCGAVRACTSAWSTWWLRPRCAHRPTQSGTSSSASGQEGAAQAVVGGARKGADPAARGSELSHVLLLRTKRPGGTCRQHTGPVRGRHPLPQFGSRHASHMCVWGTSERRFLPSLAVAMRRGPGQIIGDTSLNGKPVPAAATVRARSRMRVLLVRAADAAALVSQPSIKAALCRSQTESSVLDALETFAAYDGEVAAIDEVRRSRVASFAAGHTARGGGIGGLLGSGGSGIPGLGGAGHGSGQWLATASSVGSTVGPLESCNSVASSLASFTSAMAAAAAGGGSGVGGASQSALQAAAAAAATAGSGRSSPTALLSSSPARVPSWTAGGFGSPNPASEGPGDALFVGGAGPDRSGSPSAAGPLGSPLRPGSRGNSFTAGSTTPRGGLRGTSSRLGLSVQIGGQQVMSPVASPRVYLQMDHEYTV